MRSTEFDRQILGLDAPWSGRKVDLDMAAKRVVVRVEIDRKPDSNLARSLGGGQSTVPFQPDDC
jgi:hypothetical protein